MSNNSPFNPLTPEESRVILNKGTERPYTGEYTDNKAEGTYICRQCNAPLYRSADKFDSRCGWPSFDDEIDGAVTRKTDADGRRTEIICSNCNGHLGHVFEGEGFTEKDTRHCVNSISMVFVPSGEPLPKVLGKEETSSNLDTATLGAGCFWCVDAVFQELKGVEKVEVGYSGGKIKAPTYKMVCAGGTGHVEVARIFFDPEIITYEQLLDIFFHTHDPTTLNRQGNDVGDQYRSVIFYHNERQKEIAEKVMKSIDSGDLWDDPIVTSIEPLSNYYVAEDYHQNYYNQNQDQGYCSVVIAPKIKKFRKKYKDLLKE
ncbi:bifunctional methionine sulfoxide reductase B/A protein [bacterium]|nr:bifunctional methionine sulfoxide reductase B/A protein [bacterium]